MSIETIVYLGPSLPLANAKACYPNACFHGPARCGDFIKAMRLKPKRLVIIDGYFEQTAAIWHKEILYALSHGVEVWGASSMGALRAAECHTFGMQGMGLIFERFRDGVWQDDDEVALVHTADGASRITPMVNLRMTIEHGLEQAVFSAQAAADYLSAVKALPYYNRTGFEISNHAHIAAWCKAHYVDQKAEDATTLLKTLADTPIQAPTCSHPYNTVFYRKITFHMLHAPFDQTYQWLPDYEAYFTELDATRQHFVHFLGQCLQLAAQNHEHSMSMPALLEWAQTLTDKKFESELAGVYLDIRFSSLVLQEKMYQEMCALISAIASVFMQDNDIHHDIRQQVLNEMRLEHELYSIEEMQDWQMANHMTDPHVFDRFVSLLTIMNMLIDKANVDYIGDHHTVYMQDWVKEIMLADH